MRIVSTCVSRSPQLPPAADPELSLYPPNGAWSEERANERSSSIVGVSARLDSDAVSRVAAGGGYQYRLYLPPTNQSICGGKSARKSMVKTNAER